MTIDFEEFARNYARDFVAGQKKEEKVGTALRVPVGQAAAMEQRESITNHVMTGISKRVSVELSDDNKTVIEKMSEGNIEAQAILVEVLHDRLLGGHMAILTIDDMNIRGSQIVAGYKYCGNSVGAFLCCVRERDSRMVDAINLAENQNGHEAYLSGASCARKGKPALVVRSKPYAPG